MIRAYARWLAALVVAHVGYRIRPYDMLADRRRWFWQRPQRCLQLPFTWASTDILSFPKPPRPENPTGESR